MKNYLIMFVFFILGTVIGALVHAHWNYVLEGTKAFLLYLFDNWIGLATLICTMVGVYIAFLNYLNSLN